MQFNENLRKFKSWHLKHLKHLNSSQFKLSGAISLKLLFGVARWGHLSPRPSEASWRPLPLRDLPETSQKPSRDLPETSQRPLRDLPETSRDPPETSQTRFKDSRAREVNSIQLKFEEVLGLGIGTTQIFPQPENRDFAKSDHLSVHNWPLVQPFST